ncbi:hypothetical protein FC85_GL002558 [Lentilactobacillus diolivorans DSM 14421]|uniref:Uncharacterized protein n=2 Tax=Lentilactobacillus diolivorans TaxID=179838 RepID=A0A0R1SP35_9LACO|nr:hypothetical protein FC85_GL002558 [Lentilactobacillus diolivorans DSM 14421]
MAGSCGSFARFSSGAPNTTNIPDFGILAWGTYMAGSCGSFARFSSGAPNTTNIPDFGILAWGTYMAGSCGSFARLGSVTHHYIHKNGSTFK